MFSNLLKVLCFIIVTLMHVGGKACVEGITNSSIVENSMVEVENDVVRLYIAQPEELYKVSYIKISYDDKISIMSKWNELKKNKVNYVYLTFEVYEGQFDKVRLNLGYTKKSKDKSKTSLCMTDKTINLEDFKIMEK